MSIVRVSTDSTSKGTKFCREKLVILVNGYIKKNVKDATKFYDLCKIIILYLQISPQHWEFLCAQTIPYSTILSFKFGREGSIDVHFDTGIGGPKVRHFYMMGINEKALARYGQIVEIIWEYEFNIGHDCKECSYSTDLNHNWKWMGTVGMNVASTDCVQILFGANVQLVLNDGQTVIIHVTDFKFTDTR